MKKLQFVSLIVLALSIILWTADRIFFFLPDWTIRLNGVIMLAGAALLVFASVRLTLNKEDD